MGRMTRIIATRTAALAALALLSATAADTASPLNIVLGQSVHVPVGGTVANVIVTNPAVADVIVVDSHSVIVQGKGSGTSQIMALDTAGHVLLDSVVTVNGARSSAITLYRGLVGQEISCTPRCEVVGSANSAASAAGPVPMAPIAPPAGVASSAPSAVNAALASAAPGG
jgi:hypothetical protein